MDSFVTYEQLCAVLEQEHARWYTHPAFDDAKDSHLSESRPWLPAFLSLMWLTGGRVSEILQLSGRDIATTTIDGIQVAHINLTNLKQQPGRNRRKVCSTVIDEYPICWEHIDNYHEVLIEQDGLLFHRTRQVVWYHCNRIFQLGAHKVGRHSWVMNHARKDSPLLEIKQQGGWTRLESMNSYIHEFGINEITANQLSSFKKRRGDA